MNYKLLIACGFVGLTATSLAADSAASLILNRTGYSVGTLIKCQIHPNLISPVRCGEIRENRRKDTLFLRGNSKPAWESRLIWSPQTVASSNTDTKISVHFKNLIRESKTGQLTLTWNRDSKNSGELKALLSGLGITIKSGFDELVSLKLGMNAIVTEELLPPGLRDFDNYVSQRNKKNKLSEIFDGKGLLWWVEKVIYAENLTVEISHNKKNNGTGLDVSTTLGGGFIKSESGSLTTLKMSFPIAVLASSSRSVDGKEIRKWVD